MEQLYVLTTMFVVAVCVSVYSGNKAVTYGDFSNSENHGKIVMICSLGSGFMMSNIIFPDIFNFLVGVVFLSLFVYTFVLCFTEWFVLKVLHNE